MKLKSSRSLFTIAILSLGASLAATAATKTWDGANNSSGNWFGSGNSGANNWNPNGSPAANDDLAFAGTNNLSTNNNGTADVNYASITFNSGAGAFTLAGTRITLGGNVTNNSTTLQTISLAMILSATRTFDAAAGNLTASGIISDGGSGYGITKSGANTLLLSGANTFSGPALLNTNAGVLSLGNLNALQNATLDTGASGTQSVSFSVAGTNTYNIGALTGADALAIGANTLSVGAKAGSTSFSGDLTGTGGLTKVGAGSSLTLTGTGSSYSGTTLISAGTILANNVSGSATGTGAVSVGASGTLGGTGFIAPTGTNGINVTGVLSPGASIGTLTFNLGSTTGTVMMNSAASFRYELGAAGLNINSVGTSDLISLAGAGASDFAFSGNNIDFLGTGSAGFYKLFDTSSNNANTWTGLTVSGTGLITGGLTVSNLTSGLSGNLIMGGNTLGGTAGDIYLQVVPEPSATLLGGIGTLLLLRRRRTA